MYVKEVIARKIKDSRHEETIEVEVLSEDGKFIASSPSGKSKGKHEASAFSYRGIDFSIAVINEIGKKLASGISLNDFDDLIKVERIVRKVDKTANFSLIGANALYALESALLKAVAASYGLELWQLFCEKPKHFPKPLGNCIGGGKHLKQETKTDFQEFLLMPKTKHFFDAYFINLQGYKFAKQLLLERDRRYENKLTDENALGTTLSNEEALDLLSDVRKMIKEKFDVDVIIGLDLAASGFWHNGYYWYKNPEKKRDKQQQISYLIDLVKKYNISYLEDPLEEEDFSGFSQLLRELKKWKLPCVVVGDDLTATQFSRVERAIQEKSINALIIKPNQNGSLLETKRIVDYAKDNKITPIISHRSGETLDNTIAHLAVGWQIPIIKTGILGKERFAKLHEILHIEREVAGKKDKD
jgi:enolase